MTRVLVVGGGGREHAIAWACARDRDDVELIVAPGNAGTAEIAENVDVSPVDGPGIARLAAERAVDLVVIGPDAAAAAGVADACLAEGVAVFGPTAAAARIESSKAFAKSLMDTAGIPTARYVTGGNEDRRTLERFVAEVAGRCVVKADGLALGKGVTVCESIEEAGRALDDCFALRRFGAAGERVVVEERLHGREVSVLGITDGRSVRVLVPARDYKRALDDDGGPNTGGMGAVAPPVDSSDATFIETVRRDVLQPCVDALRDHGTPFTGCLYAGLMLTDDGMRVLEFNARFGDPEAQVVLPLLAESPLELLTAAVGRALQPGIARRRQSFAVAVVAAAAGYPDQPRTGDVVTGLDTLDPSVLCFHAGTRRDDSGAIRTSGGRVLSVVAVDADLDGARSRAYDNLGRLRFEGMQRRSDIGLTRSHAVVSGAVQ